MPKTIDGQRGEGPSLAFSLTMVMENSSKDLLGCRVRPAAASALDLCRFRPAEFAIGYWQGSWLRHYGLLRQQARVWNDRAWQLSRYSALVEADRGGALVWSSEPVSGVSTAPVLVSGWCGTFLHDQLLAVGETAQPTGRGSLSRPGRMTGCRHQGCSETDRQDL